MPSFKAWYGDWQNAGYEQDERNPRLLKQPAGINGDLDERRGENVNAIQRRGSMGADHPASVRVGETIFTRSAGPVGKDGRPMVIYYGTRDTVTAFLNSAVVGCPQRRARATAKTVACPAPSSNAYGALEVMDVVSLGQHAPGVRVNRRMW